MGYISNGRPKVILGDAEIIKKVFSMDEVTNRPPQGSRGKFRYGKSTGELKFYFGYLFHTFFKGLLEVFFLAVVKSGKSKETLFLNHLVILALESLKLRRKYGLRLGS